MIRSLTLACFGSVLVLSGLMLCGCGEKPPAPVDTKTTTPTPVTPKVAIKLPADLTALKAEAEKGMAQLDLVIASLEATVAAADGDPKPAFGKFQKDFEALKAQVATIRSRADAMKSKGTAYFKTWEEQLAQISTPEIKTAAAARKDALAKIYDAILADTAKAREGYDKFALYLGDVSKVMENDLNAQGLKAIGPKVAEAKSSAGQVKTDTGAIVAELDKIAAIYSPGK